MGMIESLKNIFGIGPSVDFKSLVKEGAQIVDVRTRGEYNGGHIPGSINIPLQEFSAGMKKLKKNQPVITCCASGMRSASAAGILKSAGFEPVHNGGGWYSLMQKITQS